MDGKLVLVDRYNLCEEISKFVLSTKKEDTSIFLSQETANLLKEKAWCFQKSLLSDKYCEISFTSKSNKFMDILTEKKRIKSYGCVAYRIMSYDVMFKNNKKKHVDFKDSENEIIIVIGEE